MKRFMNKTLLGLLGLGLAASGLVGCYEGEIYDAGAPDDLQQKIDSIAAAKQQAAAGQGDTTMVDITKDAVGAKDFSLGWNQDWSQLFEIPVGKAFVVEFKNYSPVKENWNNWNWCLTSNAEAKSTDDEHYFIMRSDAYAVDQGDAIWGDRNYGNDECPWEEWKTYMDKADVKLIVDHAIDGITYIRAEQTGNNGTMYWEELRHEKTPNNASVYGFLVCDASYMEISSAYMIPSEKAPAVDQPATKLEIVGAISAVEIGETDFWKDAKAIVTFEDGTTAEADTADITFTIIPDMSTIGTKTVVAAYSKTKQGAFGQAVAATYQFEVTNAVKSIKATYKGGKLYYAENDILISNKLFAVEATYSDGGTGTLAESSYTAILTKDGKVIVKYSDQVSTEVAVETEKGTSEAGLTDRSSSWVATGFGKVEPGKTVTAKVFCYSRGINNWDGILPELTYTKEDGGTGWYCTVRVDNYGWGDTYINEDQYKDCTILWDTFLSDLYNGIDYTVSVTNNGDGTALIAMSFAQSDGELHKMNYTITGIHKDDCVFDITIDGAYAVFHN
ncbi:MAG: hypothetical protein MJZ66_00895 [Bacteroidales bacterium]|nr:hypothetical protein [Bacteroidales bacterium]